METRLWFMEISAATQLHYGACYNSGLTSRP